jgi:hypothetical protein
LELSKNNMIITLVLDQLGNPKSTWASESKNTQHKQTIKVPLNVNCTSICPWVLPVFGCFPS